MAKDTMRKFGHRFFASGFILRPVAGWVLAAAIVTLVLVVGSARMATGNHASPMVFAGDGTDLVLRIRGLPYSQTVNRYGNRVAMSEAQLLIRTRLLTGENGVSRLLIDARLVSSDGQNIWSSTKISENAGLEFVQEEIGRTLTEAMQHVELDGGRISI
ncbi:MAG: hypothetical protein O7C03_02440 [Gammaproteobacteria bacterium]|nr:hypothetical protein [Gammaproteobacteria bacterium]MCZ6761841.1 hypothetical protein [Gammaproteobacteria bacterium]